MMYKNLCTDGLGVSVRQNELIELALTYGFRGIEIDMADMAARTESMGKPFATQFINSASVEVGTFGLPCDLAAIDEVFDAQLEKLDLVCELAESIEAKRCYLSISTEHDALPYHENFEKHRARILAIADKLAKIGTQCGLKLNTPTPGSDAMQFIHKADDLITLVKTIDHKFVGVVLDACNWQTGQFTTGQLASLNIDKITEVRFADPPENPSAHSDEASRLAPGTHPISLCNDVLEWLKENEFAGPVALTANIPVSRTNPGEGLFQRISVSFDSLLAGQPIVEIEEAVEESGDETTEPVSSAAE